MGEKQWADVDTFITNSVVRTDKRLTTALANSANGGLPEIQVSQAQAEFLSIMVRMLAAKRVLEIGTLGAYSTIAMARELPNDGYLLTMEADPHHADVAATSIAVSRTGGFGRH